MRTLFPDRSAAMRPGRRRFFAVSVGAITALVVDRSLGPSTPRSFAAVSSSLAPGAPLAFLSTDTVPQGGAFSLHLQTFYATSGTATFNGVQYTLIANGEYLESLFGAGQPVNDETEIPPGEYEVAVNAFDTAGRAFSFALPITVTPTSFPVDAIDLPASTSALLAPATVEIEVARLRAIYSPVTTTPLWQGLFRPPVTGPITTEFGEARAYNGGPVSGHHSGVDIGVDLGTPVAAAASGRVAFTGPLSERGNFVVIDHGLGVYTGYAHLSRILTAVGAAVTQGEIIGAAGTTGLSTGPHLHWECSVNGVHVNAMRWTRVLLP